MKVWGLEIRVICGRHELYCGKELEKHMSSPVLAAHLLCDFRSCAITRATRMSWKQYRAGLALFMDWPVCTLGYRPCAPRFVLCKVRMESVEMLA